MLLQSETKVEPDLRLGFGGFGVTIWFNCCQNFKCLAAKHVMSGTLLLEHVFVLCPLLDATHSNFVIFAILEKNLKI